MAPILSKYRSIIQILLDLIIKFNLFYYAITGAIISFCFANTDKPHIKYALWLPIIMSIVFAGFFLYGAFLMEYIRKDVFAIRDALQFKVAPDVRVLSVLLCIFSGVFILIAFGCGFVFFGTLISQ